MTVKEKTIATQEQKPLIEVNTELSTKDALVETLKLGGAALTGTLAAKLVGKFGPIAGLPIMYYGVKTGNLPLILGGAGMLSGSSGKPSKPENGIEDHFENWLEDLKEKFLINDVLNLTAGSQSPLSKPKTEIGKTNISSSTIAESIHNEQVMPSNYPIQGMSMDNDEVEEIDLDPTPKAIQSSHLGTIDFFKSKELVSPTVNPAFFGLNANNELY